MTEQMNLGGAWRMREADSETWHSAHVPGSVYADLMADGTMPDPFWRENELDAFERMKKDYVYQRTFTVTEAQLAHAHVELVCEGLDTLAACVAQRARNRLRGQHAHHLGVGREGAAARRRKHAGNPI